MIVIVKDMKKQTNPNLQTLKKQLGGLTIKAALLVLIQKYRRSSQSLFIGAKAITVGQLYREICDPIASDRCDTFDVRFYGGPPSTGGWFNGTVLTVLCDAVLFEEHNKEPFEIAMAL